MCAPSPRLKRGEEYPLREDGQVHIVVYLRTAADVMTELTAAEASTLETTA